MREGRGHVAVMCRTIYFDIVSGKGLGRSEEGAVKVRGGAGLQVSIN